MQTEDGPRKDGRWYDLFPKRDLLTDPEVKEVLSLNEQRGTLPLIHYRNSKLGKNDELAYLREKNLQTKFYLK